ncbi:MAG: hypothetical protein P8Q17_06190 [Methylophilaceae bacterium]|nr:hypothetical protein [Methylophilaceae bacterium]
MKFSLAKYIVNIIIISMIFGCSTTGGIYKKGDSENGEFSIGKTVLGVVGVVGAVLAIGAAANGAGGNSYAAQTYARDYQPGNGQWVCRNAANGQYAYEYQCNGQPYVDGWP